MIELQELARKAREADLAGIQRWWAGLTGADIFNACPALIDAEDVTGLQNEDAMRALLALFLGTNPDAAEDLPAPEYSRLRTLIAATAMRAGTADKEYTAQQKEVMDAGDGQFVEAFRRMTGRSLRRIPTGATYSGDPTGRCTKVFFEALAAELLGLYGKDTLSAVQELRAWPAVPYLYAVRAAHMAFFCSVPEDSEGMSSSVSESPE